MRTIEGGTSEFTEVVALDEQKYGASHLFEVKPVDGDQNPPFAQISFQKGPIKEAGRNGCHNEDLLIIVLDRLNGFQNTDFKCRENALAITKIEEALHWLRARTNARKARNVEGTHKV
ncbi:MAG: hypothetical protein KKB59_18960 [Spirochaetes bacterium]|nr:hypothetical protein [Spirochaetota bacterium]